MIGYTHGRYQPLHNGHFNTMLHILENYDQLWIGIANPLREFPRLTDDSDEDLLRSLKKARSVENNPFTYVQRQEMIISSLIQEGVEPTRFRIVPHFAFYDSINWTELLPPVHESIIVLAAKDYHHYKKIECYRQLGWRVEFVRPLEGVSGERFDCEYPNGEWRALVPAGAIGFLENQCTK